MKSKKQAHLDCVDSINGYVTYLWQELRGKPEFRIQTKDSRIARKLKRRQQFSLAVEGINTILWVFRGKYSTPQKARQSLSRLTNAPVKWDSIDEVFYSKTYPKTRRGDK
jgi:hypothetical protein